MAYYDLDDGDNIILPPKTVYDMPKGYPRSLARDIRDTCIEHGLTSTRWEPCEGGVWVIRGTGKRVGPKFFAYAGQVVGTGKYSEETHTFLPVGAGQDSYSNDDPRHTHFPTEESAIRNGGIPNCMMAEESAIRDGNDDDLDTVRDELRTLAAKLVKLGVNPVDTPHDHWLTGNVTIDEWTFSRKSHWRKVAEEDARAEEEARTLKELVKRGQTHTVNSMTPPPKGIKVGDTVIVIDRRSQANLYEVGGYRLNKLYAKRGNAFVIPSPGTYGIHGADYEGTFAYEFIVE